MASQYYGQHGDSVLQMQKKMNALGAGLKEDGIWGKKTEAAYGRLGSQLETAPAPATAPVKSTAQQLAETETAKPVYQESDTLKNAAQALADWQAKKPGEYVSPYGGDIKTALDKLLNWKAPEYDFSSDPTYNAIKDAAQKSGRMAMMDTVGQAAAMTGGYGNSYGATAGEQVYQGTLAKVNDVIPELAAAARSKSMDERNQIASDLSALQGAEATDYQKYEGDANDYYNTLQFLAGRVDTMTDEERQQYNTLLSTWQDQRNYLAAKNQDELSAAAKASSGGGGHGGGGGGGNAYAELLSGVDENKMTTTYAEIDDAYVHGFINDNQRNVLVTKMDQFNMKYNKKKDKTYGTSPDTSKYNGWVNGHYYVNGIQMK